MTACAAIYSPYTIKLARQAGYMLAGRAISMSVRCLLDVCSTFAQSCKRGITNVVAGDQAKGPIFTPTLIFCQNIFVKNRKQIRMLNCLCRKF